MKFFFVVIQLSILYCFIYGNMNQTQSPILAALSPTWTYQWFMEESAPARADAVVSQPTCGGPGESFSGPVLTCSDSFWTPLTFVNFISIFIFFSVIVNDDRSSYGM